MTKDAKLEPGVDTIRDPFTGVVYEIESILKPEDLPRFNHGPYRGSAAEKCALFGTTTKEEFRVNRSRGRSFTHRGPKEAA